MKISGYNWKQIGAALPILALLFGAVGSTTITEAGKGKATSTAKSSTIRLSPGAPSVLLNISTRARVLAGENVLIGGFIITGTDAKKVIIRGIGPSLAQFFAGALANPTLELFQGDTLLESNDNWKDDNRAAIEATGIPPSNDLESAIVRTLPPGAYTAILHGKDDTTGIGVVEAYDLDQAANSKLANIATRSFIDTDDNVLIGGLIVGPPGGASTTVVVRAPGPSLANFDIANSLQDPTLELHNGNGTTVASNDNWKTRPDGSSQQAVIEATGLQPSDDRESVLVQTVDPGNYTAIVRGNGGTTGVGLVEVYNVTNVTILSVPNVTGLTQAAAANTLNAAGLTVGGLTQENSDTVPAGNIIRQRPAAGASVLPGSAVDLVVSLGPIDPGLPPDPITIAPPLDPTVGTDIGTATEFLYTGPNPIQTGVAPGTIDKARVAVLKGKVFRRDGTVLSGVRLSVLSHSEFGQTLSRADGAFDLAVNGGGQLTVRYEKDGFLSAQRPLVAPWRDYASLADVVLVPFDPVVTEVAMGDPAMQIARGSAVSDADGTRQATIIVPAGTSAEMVLPDGSRQPLSRLHMRATEYTIGDSGPKAMPAPLPPSSGYTYAAELSVDEAVAAGATELRFNQALPTYVENFIGFPVGTAVPTGYYDRQKGQWIPSTNGRVIKVLGITNNLVDLDIDGDNTADDETKLAALGVTSAERARLAQLYTVSQTLWRVPITHFTPWDCNWPYGPPGDAINPPGRNPTNPPVDKPNKECGSVIGVENQTLGESVPVTGTPWRLHYASGRTPGRKDAFTLEIPLSGETIPTSLRQVRVEVNIAGRQYRAALAPAPNLSYTVTWDGKDGYGRSLQSAQLSLVRIDYDYMPQYYAVPADFTSSFARAEAAGTAVISSRGSSTITLSKTWSELLGAWDARALGLGGWSLSIQHAYDPASRTLFLGAGGQRSAEALSLHTITTVAGNGLYGFSGDGGPAIAARLGNPIGVAVAPDGSLFIADFTDNRIRRVAPDGIITTVAGNGSLGFSGDGGPATSAQLREPTDVAVGVDGSLFIADSLNSCIRRVGPDGIITTVAGNGRAGLGDGGPATAAQLNGAFGVAVGPDGSLFIADCYHSRIRRVGPDGIITTVAGNGLFGFGGDGGPATAAPLNGPVGVAVGPDGSFVIADVGNHRIRRVASDGLILTVAGNGFAGFSGDGGPATAARLHNPNGVALGPDGSLFIGDLVNNRIRHVGPGGIITTAAGTDPAGFSGDGGPAAAAQLQNPHGVAVGPDGSLFIAATSNTRVRRVRPALPDFSLSDILLASEDGREVFLFNSTGRHLKTLEALTGALRYQFGYSLDGYLSSVTDGSGNVTSIERTGAILTAIVAPGGQRTALSAGPDGWLQSAANPANESHAMSYSGDGLLQTFTDPLGNIHRYSYDAVGRLIKDEDPVGGSTTLSRTEQSNGYTVTTSSALGQTAAYQVEQLPTGSVRRTVNGDCCGLRSVTIFGTDGSEQSTNADGSLITLQYGPDPRFGMLAPRLLKRVRKVPGGETETTTSIRAISLADPNNLLSLKSLTDTVTTNGRTFTRAYDATIRTMTDTSAAGRRTVSVLDAQGRVTRQEPGPGIMPIAVTYDNQGRVAENRQGTQVLTYTYDARNRLASRIDAAGRSVSLLYDDADRLIRKTLPSGAVYQFTYDANGNRTELILPSGAHHALGYSPNNRDISYTPPNNGSYTRTFNIGRQLTHITLPSGRSTEPSYDSAGRVTGMSYPEATTAFEYSPDDLTERVAHITNTPATGPAQNIDYSYNGNLISSMTATGAAPAQVAYTYDNNFLPTNVSLSSGTDTVQAALLWDRDGLLTGFGPFTFTRSGPRGALNQIRDAATATSYSYDNVARLSRRSHVVNAQTKYVMQLTYDATGRITAKTETANGTTHTYIYAYDLDGQLTEVQRDSTVSEKYGYDVNGNRTSRQFGNGVAEAASYDGQDRLLQRGSVAYEFDADGFLAKRGGDVFQYSTRGQLLRVTIVGGQTITYGYDGLARRVSRSDSSGTYQYLYGDPASHLVTATRAPSGELTTLFYDTEGLLIAMDRGGARYYVASDQIGSPRVVSNSAGTAVKVIEYDSLGNVLADSNPVFDLPIGYAGGLTDAASALVHFAFRDYDPASGRWTARDPVLFQGGQVNLYAYVGNSPIKYRDPLGLICVNASLYQGFGGGVGFCIDDEGASVCAEVGLGVGASLEIDNKGELEETGTELVGEISIGIGPGELGLGAALNDDGCFKLTPKAKLGPITYEPGKQGLKPELHGAPKIAEGAEAKVAAKGCVKGKF
jgi:RHS repeat-associated protein